MVVAVEGNRCRIDGVVLDHGLDDREVVGFVPGHAAVETHQGSERKNCQGACCQDGNDVPIGHAQFGRPAGRPSAGADGSHARPERP